MLPGRRDRIKLEKSKISLAFICQIERSADVYLYGRYASTILLLPYGGDHDGIHHIRGNNWIIVQCFIYYYSRSLAAMYESWTTGWTGFVSIVLRAPYKYFVRICRTRCRSVRTCLSYLYGVVYAAETQHMT